MKKLKLGIFATILIGLLAGIEAIAGIKVDLPDRNEQSPGQITYRKGEIGPMAAKLLSWIPQESMAWRRNRS